MGTEGGPVVDRQGSATHPAKLGWLQVPGVTRQLASNRETLPTLDAVLQPSRTWPSTEAVLLSNMALTSGARTGSAARR